ncbi:MAG TPA: DUF72 domain-containing protein [Gemmatimonadaceae bacterium]|nr:DUF72 domain-containing protein [Gemmatimonadaceae bacterium]
MTPDLYIGCAGWTLGRSKESFPAEGSVLQRYATVFNSVEITSSFYRSHKLATYERWASTVPEHFRFSVKLPKEITHERRFADSEAPLDSFLGEIAALGGKLACILVQTRPKMELDAPVASSFFEMLRTKYSGAVVVEPRNASWFTEEAGRLFDDCGLSRVATDPTTIPGADEPGGSRSAIYYRLHGSPQMYYSAYTDSYLDDLAGRIRTHAVENHPVWCIFDNTISGAATANALYLRQNL